MIACMATSMRIYRHPDDLRLMQGLARRIWSPSSQYHVGDLAWGRRQHLGREREWPTALWEDGGEVVAWGWTQLPDSLMLLVDPARPELVDEVLRWFHGVAGEGTLSVVVLEYEKHVIAGLERHGYVRNDTVPFHRFMRRALTDLPEPVLPAGFTVRSVRGPDDAARRAAVHQEAWHPSRVTEASYRTVMDAWPYRPDLDWVVEAPDGAFAASCLIWLDDHHRVGELEPVGTAPRFRRMGLGRAVCLAALHSLRETGAEQAIVYPVQGNPDFPAAYPLYESLGFRPYGRTHTYELIRR